MIKALQFRATERGVFITHQTYLINEDIRNARDGYSVECFKKYIFNVATYNAPQLIPYTKDGYRFYKVYLRGVGARYNDDNLFRELVDNEDPYSGLVESTVWKTPLVAAIDIAKVSTESIPYFIKGSKSFLVKQGNRLMIYSRYTEDGVLLREWLNDQTN